MDYEGFQRLTGHIAIYRAGQALIRGSVADTLKYADQALDLLPPEDDFRRGAASGLLGLAYWTSGDLESGLRMYTECMARLQRAGFISDTFGCALVIADICLTQGRLHDAMSTYERALQLATTPGAPALRGTSDMHVGMSEIQRERGDLDAALHHLQASKELGEHLGLLQNPYRWCAAMARIREAQGDLNSALDLLSEAERLYVGDFSPNVHPISASKTRLWIALGRLGEAIGWARERGLSVDDDLSYLREFEHITLARISIARYTSERDERTIQEAMGLLDQLLRADRECDRDPGAAGDRTRSKRRHHHRACTARSGSFPCRARRIHSDVRRGGRTHGAPAGRCDRSWDHAGLRAEVVAGIGRRDASKRASTCPGPCRNRAVPDRAIESTRAGGPAPDCPGALESRDRRVALPRPEHGQGP